jgi:hypothetical protein
MTHGHGEQERGREYFGGTASRGWGVKGQHERRATWAVAWTACRGSRNIGSTLAGDNVEPKMQGRRLKHTSKRCAGGSAGERQLRALGLYGDVAAIKAAKKQHVDQHRPTASVPRRPAEMRSRGAMLLRMALDRMLHWHACIEPLFLVFEIDVNIPRTTTKEHDF